MIDVCSFRTQRDRYRRIKHQRQVDAEGLRRALLALVTADPRLHVVQPDPALQPMLHRLGLSGCGLGEVGAVIGGRWLTLISIPDWIWHTPATRTDLLRLKALAKQIGCRIVLVPPSVIRREPRLGNSELIASSSRHSISVDDRAAILAEMDLHGSMPLSACIGCLKTPEPVLSVLSLMRLGLLRCRMDRPLTFAAQVWRTRR